MSGLAATILASCALLLAATGCGGDSSAFKEDYNRAIRPLTEVTRGGAAGDFDWLALRLQRTARNLRRLEPPADAEAEFDELLAALRAGASDLRAMARSVEERDPGARREAIRDLGDTVAEIRDAESALQNAVGG